MVEHYLNLRYNHTDYVEVFQCCGCHSDNAFVDIKINFNYKLYLKAFRQEWQHWKKWQVVECHPCACLSPTDFEYQLCYGIAQNRKQNLENQC